MGSPEDFKAVRTLFKPGERELVDNIREEVAAELDDLAAQGCDFPHTTGDIFLLRVLRGNEGNVTNAIRWYRRCLDARKQFEMDKVFQAVRDLPFDVAKLPGYDCVSKHLLMIADEKSLCTPSGDLIQCDFMGDADWNRFMSEVGARAYLQWQLHVQEARSAALDRLSRSRGHLVKYVHMCDLKDMSFPPRQFMAVEKRVKTEINETTSIEAVHKIIFMNAPSAFYHIWRMATPLLPQRTLSTVSLLNDELSAHPEIIAEVGTTFLTKHRALRSPNSSEGVGKGVLQGLQLVIPAGTTFERHVDIAVGQRVTWTFKLGDRDDFAAAGSNVRGSLGSLIDTFGQASDVLFEVAAFWDDEQGDEKLTPDEVYDQLYEPKQYDASDGEVSGSLVAPRSGLLLLRWSNSFGWVRAKLLASFCITAHDRKETVS